MVFIISVKTSNFFSMFDSSFAILPSSRATLVVRPCSCVHERVATLSDSYDYM
jgi:hypothetical protein